MFINVEKYLAIFWCCRILKMCVNSYLVPVFSFSMVATFPDRHHCHYSSTRNCVWTSSRHYSLMPLDRFSPPLPVRRTCKTQKNWEKNKILMDFFFFWQKRNDKILLLPRMSERTSECWNHTATKKSIVKSDVLAQSSHHLMNRQQKISQDEWVMRLAPEK